MAIRRIVSLAPSITEILFALGLGSRVVGVTEVCDYPPEARSKPKVGDYQISPEKVVALQPDLVVAHELLNQRVIPVLRQLGLRILSANPNRFEKLFAFIRAIGRTVGAERPANQLVRSMQARVARVRQHTPAAKPRALFLISVEPLWAAGRDTFADEMMTLAGARNALADLVSGFKPVSIEVALSGAPQLILLAGPKQDAILRNARWQRTPAVQRRRVHELNPDWVLRESPRSVNGLEQIAQAVRQQP